MSIDVLFYTIASPEIGHGHVMRAYALSQVAESQGLNTCFAHVDEYTTQVLQGLGQQIVYSPDKVYKPKFVIRDIWGGSNTQDVEKEVTQGSIVLLIDDLGTARTAAPIVTNALMTPSRATKFSENPRTQYLNGLQYAILRPEFKQWHQYANPGQRNNPHLFICFGGSDAQNLTYFLTHALHERGFNGPATIIGDANSHYRIETKNIVKQWRNSQYLENVSNIPELMQISDLVVTKLGVVMLEAFCLGLGCVTIEPTLAHLERQQEQRDHYSEWPVTTFGLSSDIDYLDVAFSIIEILSDGFKLKNMGLNASSLVDGLGVDRLFHALYQRENNF